MTGAIGVKVIGLVLLTPALALACGACLEDKMAATYDYAVSRQAAAKRLAVVYCDVQGQVTAERLRRAAAQVDGLDATSVRTSGEPAAMSFALDTTVSSAAAAVSRISTALGGAGKVTLLRSVEPDNAIKQGRP
ncbi:MAG: hypothetical protein JSR59_13140 [Proteobacteria bacterium]|nr:hypothetical protein [Pseudomonadota bacterium]